ncbi:hypothetical protein V3468_06015 [Flavobacterium oreochromis]|uniref:hypothetical protein n=1 Tax=Flavobacterium oreochromis TaxID=2906078 RepID=UPI00385C50D7
MRKFDSLDKLLNTIDTKTPILLTIDGKGVLHKKIDTNNYEDLNWLKTVDQNSIYHTTYNNHENQFIGFCRNNLVDEYLELFKEKNYEVLDLYIGNFLGALLKDFISSKEFSSGDLKLEWEEQQLIHFERTEKNSLIKIGTDEIQQTHIPLYAAGLHFYLQHETIQKTQHKKINIEEIIYKQAFNKLGIIMLVSVFLLLLISYSLIQYYGAKNTDLNLQNLYSNQSYKKLQELDKKRKQQLIILNESGLTSNTYISHLTHDIFCTVPNNIKLNELSYFPIDKEIKPEKKILLTPKTIFIKGQTQDEFHFNNWLNEIRKLNWIKKFEIISLKKDKKNISHFEIKIVL